VKIVYFSPVSWDSVAQRPHFFVKAAIEYGCVEVLWVNPTPSRLPNLQDIMRITSKNRESSFERDKKITVLTPKVLPLEPLGRIFDIMSLSAFRSLKRKIEDFSDENTYIISGKPSRIVKYIVENVSYKKFILDVMDDYPEFYCGISKKSMISTLDMLVEKSDVCIFSSNSLADKFASKAKQSSIIKNACDESLVEAINASKGNISSTNSEPDHPRVFGYIGSLANWFDWDAVIRIAERYPSCHVKLIGPRFSAIPQSLPSNISIHPPIEHSRVSTELLKFDFGLIPFKINKLTDSVDPVKYYEYCAAGLTVVSSRFGEMSQRIDREFAIDINKFDIDVGVHAADPVTWKQRFFPFFEHHFGVVKA
jgi:teichuronic acid biosynthesis glycosyltransferase TuaH